MKIISFIILNYLVLGLSAQTRKDSIYIVSEKILKTSTGDIFGILTVPKNSKTSPLVIIIAGSGATDMDCNSPAGIQTNAYKMLAESFAANSISTFRFDKRGVGKSKSAVASEKELRFETYIKDVVSFISLFKKDNRFSKIIILGHSEGSLIGMIAAEQTNVSAFISISGAGKSADKVLQEQLRDKLPFQLLSESNRILDSLKAGKTVSKVSSDLLAIFRPGIQPYMISWIKYDPAKEISKLKIPVLIIQGTTDLQVTVNDAKLLSASKPDADLLIIDHMNHILKESDNDVNRNIATYSNPNLPLKSGLVEGIVSFINK